MKFETTETSMTLSASNSSEEGILTNAFKLAKEGNTITLTRKNKPTDENPNAFVVEYNAPRPILKKKKKVEDE